MKERPSFDPLIMHLPDLESVNRYVTGITEAAEKLADTFWPGPLTMVFPRRSNVPDLVTAGLDTVAVRIPQHPLALSLLHSVDFPLAAPSANPFGYISPTAADHVLRQLGEKISYVLDGGPCGVGLESTIISFAGPEPVVLRKGGIALETIFAALGGEIGVRTHSSSNPAAPGMLAQHYSPGVPFTLSENIDDQALASYQHVAHLVFGSIENARGETFNLSVEGSLEEAASRLFGFLRKMDEAEFDLIIADTLPEVGLGRAINDRLRRAAAKFV